MILLFIAEISLSLLDSVRSRKQYFFLGGGGGGGGGGKLKMPRKGINKKIFFLKMKYILNKNSEHTGVL